MLLVEDAIVILRRRLRGPGDDDEPKSWTSYALSLGCCPSRRHHAGNGGVTRALPSRSGALSAWRMVKRGLLGVGAGQPSSGHRIRRQCSKRRRYGKPFTGILSVRLLDGKNARPSDNPFSAALIETGR